jgi:hypothetical protein
MKVKRADGTEVDAGSFIAIQRAGGTYALASGGTWRTGVWSKGGGAQSYEDTSNPGKATIKNYRYDTQIETSGAPLARVGLINEGRGEMTFATQDGGRVHKRQQIYLYNEKNFYFPEGGNLKLVLGSNADCMKTCRGSGGSDARSRLQHPERQGEKGRWETRRGRGDLLSSGRGQPERSE